jgi:hypothetical protein
MKEDRSYFNEYCEMEPLGENGSLHTSYYAQLISLRGEPITPEMTLNYAKCMERALKFTAGDYLSHDNMTGIVALSVLSGNGYHLKLTHRSWHRRLHPRDLAFYFICRGGAFRFLGYILAPILVISMIISAFDSGKADNGIFKTTGKLLAWLRIHTLIRLKIPGSVLLSKLISFIIRKKHKKTWAAIFSIYFARLSQVEDNYVPIYDHPCIRHASRLYGYLI